MTKEKEVIGRIIGISELNVKVLLFSENVKINDILTVNTLIVKSQEQKFVKRSIAECVIILQVQQSVLV